MQKLAVILITFYQAFLSPVIKQLFGDTCRYTPSCSEYTKQSIKKYGIIKGSLLGLRRLSTCHPFSKIQSSK